MFQDFVIRLYSKLIMSMRSFSGRTTVCLWFNNFLWLPLHLHIWPESLHLGPSVVHHTHCTAGADERRSFLYKVPETSDIPELPPFTAASTIS